MVNYSSVDCFSPPLQGCTLFWLVAWRWLPSLLAAMSAFDLSLPCRTQHASQKHYHRTFYHSTHTPYNYLLLLLAFSSFQGLLCFLMPCSVQPQHRTSRACSQHRKSSLVCSLPSRRSWRVSPALLG